MNRAVILVIDDEAQIRKLLEITLESNDYTVNQATTAREGLALAASHPPDLIILDLGLPDENGHKVISSSFLICASSSMTNITALFIFYVFNE